MSDAELRALRRLAEEQGEAAGWERLARACVREGRWDAAGEALLHARARGGEAPDVEDALEASPVEDLEARAVPLGKQPAPITSLAWTADGTRLVYGTIARRLHVARVESGEDRRLNRTAGEIVAVATDLAGTLVAAITTIRELPPERRSALLLFDLVSGEPRTGGLEFPGRTPDQLSLWGERAGTVAVATERGATRGFTPGTSWRALTELELGWQVCLGWSGTVATVSALAVNLRACLGGEAWGEAESRPFDRGNRFERVRLSLPTARAARALAAHGLALDGEARGAVDRGSPSHSRFVPPVVRTIAISPGGRVAAMSVDVRARADSARGGLALVDLATGRFRELDLGETLALAWSPSGRKLAVATRAGLTIVEIAEGALRRLEREHAALAKTAEARRAFFDALVRDPSSGASEFLLRTLERGANDVPSALAAVEAARALARRRVPVDLERVRAARLAWPARPGLAGLADYRELLDWVVSVLEGVAAGESCACNRSFPSPLDHGTLALEGREPSTALEVTLHRCTVCSRRWRVAREVDAAEVSRHHIAELVS